VIYVALGTYRKNGPSFAFWRPFLFFVQFYWSDETVPQFRKKNIAQKFIFLLVCMGNVIEKYLCYKPEVVEDVRKEMCTVNVTGTVTPTTDTESTASFGNFMSSTEISKHPKLVRRYHSFKKFTRWHKEK